MDDRTHPNPPAAQPQQDNPQARIAAQHRAAASQAHTLARRRRGRIRVALVGVTLFVAVFSLLSYRMYVGLDPVLGDQGETQPAVASAFSDDFADELDDLEEELEDELDDRTDDETDEDEELDEDDELDEDVRSITTTTTQQPTTRAS